MQGSSVTMEDLSQKAASSKKCQIKERQLGYRHNIVNHYYYLDGFQWDKNRKQHLRQG